MLPIDTIEKLYDALESPLLDGATLRLAPGIYKLNKDKPNLGRLEFRKDMIITGDPLSADKVIIDVSDLPNESYQTPGTRSGAIRMGRGNNTLSWVTVYNDWTDGADMRSLVQTDLGNEDTTIWVENCVLIGGSIGLAIANAPGSDRNQTAYVTKNVIRNNLIQRFQFGFQIKSTGLSTYHLTVFSERNIISDNAIGMIIFNGTGNNKSITVSSKFDKIISNHAGVILYGALASDADKPGNNTVRFHAASMVVTDNGTNPAFIPFDTTLQPGGLFAAGSQSDEEGITELANNRLIVTLTDCYIKNNAGMDIEVYGESQGKPGTFFKGHSNNSALVHCRAGTIGNYKVAHSNSNNDGINLASVVVEKHLPKVVGDYLSVFDHLPDPDGTTIMGNPGVIQLADSLGFPVWRAPVAAEGNYQIHSRDHRPLIIPGFALTNSESDPFVFHNRGVNLILFNNKTQDGKISGIRLGVGTENYWEVEELATIDSPAIHGVPFGYCIAPDNESHIIYKSANGDLHDLSWQGFQAIVYGGNLTGGAGAPRCAGDPVAYNNESRSNIVIYRSVSNEIISLYWKFGDTGHDYLNSAAQTPKAIGDPSAFYITKKDAAGNVLSEYNQLVYFAEDREIYEIYWQGGATASYFEVTKDLHVPKAHSKLAFYYNQYDNTKHVVYRHGTRIHEIWWVMGDTQRTPEDLTDKFNLPEAAGDPIGFTGETEPYEHIFYKGTDGHIYELRH